MGRKIFVLFGLLSGLMAGAGLMLDGLPGGPALVSAVEEQAQPPVPPSAEVPQGEVTERGLPGQAFPPKPGMATPGAQPPIQKVIIPPKLKASPPPAPPKAQELAPKPGAKPWRSPSLSEKLDAFRNLPGGAEALAEAIRRGARMPIQTRGEPTPADPQPWSVTVSPQVPLVPGRARLDLFRLFLNILWSPQGHYVSLSSDDPGFYCGSRPYDFPCDPLPWPRAIFSVHIPRDGWYILNFEIFVNRYVPPPSGYLDTDRTGLQFSFELKTGRYSYELPPSSERQVHVFRLGRDRLENASKSLPQLLQLAAGYHQFGLYPHREEAELLEVSITEMGQ